MGSRSSDCSSFLSGFGKKKNNLIIIILIFVLFCGCGFGGGQSCCPVDPCCRRRRRRVGFGRGTSLLPILAVLALVFATNNRGGVNNTNIIKVNSDPSSVEGTSTEFSSCDY